MRKDSANFYNLDKDEQKAIKKKGILEDLPVGSQDFAKSIEKIIKTQELPYVMSIEGDFGTGKTYFATRFCEYIKKEKIDSIYINAFKYEYIKNPMICITKEICKIFEASGIKNKISKKLKTLLKNLKPTIDLTKFGVPLSLSFNTQDFLDEKDPIQDLKKEISDNIKKLNKTLVIVIDELDRCREEFLYDFLETIKHFFDIDGLCIILSLNPKYLPKKWECESIDEHFLTKFVNSRELLPIINEDSYRKVADECFKKQLETGLLKKENLQNLPKILLHYKLSLRHTREICEKIIEYYKSENRDEYNYLLPHLLCRKTIDFNKKINIEIITKERKDKFWMALQNDQLTQSHKTVLSKICFSDMWEIMFEYRYRYYSNFEIYLRNFTAEHVCNNNKEQADILVESYISDLFSELSF